MKPIHFEDVNWGTFTALHRKYKREHPTTKFKSLETFANHIIKYPNKFSKPAHKKALFYVNVILPHTANMTAVHHSKVGGYMPIMYGGSWTSAILDPMGTLKNSASAVGDVLLHGRSKYIPSAQKVLNQYGNGKIEGMTLMRTPVSNALVELTNAITSGQLNQLKQQKSFDDLFHTSLFVRVGGVTIMIQKETTVKIDVKDMNQVKNAKNGQILPVPVKPNLTLNTLLDNGEKYMGATKFYNSYSARDNNCQDWLSAVLTANGLSNGRTEKFIKQSVEEAFSPFARKVTNTITDIGHLAETAYQGGARRKPRMIMCGGSRSVIEYYCDKLYIYLFCSPRDLVPESFQNAVKSYLNLFSHSHRYKIEEARGVPTTPYIKDILKYVSHQGELVLPHSQNFREVSLTELNAILKARVPDDFRIDYLPDY
jgi:hypothetical protein